MRTRPAPGAPIAEKIHAIMKAKMEGSFAEAAVAAAALEVISELQAKIAGIKAAVEVDNHLLAGGRATEFERGGKKYNRIEFASFDELEAFFVSHLLGSDYKSKVIGKILIYWR